MSEQSFSKAAVLSIILLGLVAIIVSAFLLSSFFAIVGFSLVFWGTLLLYIIPTKNNFALLMNATAEVASANIDRMLTSTSLSSKGIYIPTEHVNDKLPTFDHSNKRKSIDNVVIFIPNSSRISMDNVLELQLSLNDGLFITPPGVGLCKILEHQMGRPFSKVNLKQFISVMPSVLTKSSKFAESVDMLLEERALTVKVVKSIFEPTCRESNKQPQTHTQVGCILSSALACALAMVIHKPVTIDNETRDLESKITQTKYIF